VPEADAYALQCLPELRIQHAPTPRTQGTAHKTATGGGELLEGRAARQAAPGHEAVTD
jgi:hypothetical protein